MTAPTPFGETIIEAAARAIWPDAFESGLAIDEARREVAREQARAALAAACAKLQEPSDRLIRAADDGVSEVITDSGIRGVWRAMLARLMVEIGESGKDSHG